MSKRAQRIRNQRAQQRRRRQRLKRQQQRRQQQRRQQQLQIKRNQSPNNSRNNRPSNRGRNNRPNNNNNRNNRPNNNNRNNRPNNNNRTNRSNNNPRNSKPNKNKPNNFNNSSNTLNSIRKISGKKWKPDKIRREVERNWRGRINDPTQYQPKRLKFNRTNTSQRLSKYTDPTTGKFKHADYVQDIKGKMTQRYVDRGGLSKTPGKVIDNKGPSVPIAKKFSNVDDIKNLYGGGKYTNPNYQKDLIDKTKNKLDDDIRHDSQQSQKYRNLGLKKIHGY